MSLPTEQHKFLPGPVVSFYKCALSIGFAPLGDNVPKIQLGIVRTLGLAFFGWVAKTYFRIQQVAPQVPPPPPGLGAVASMALRHYCNECRCSFYCS